nr:SDR family oxidoreductase [uncultured Albidiferax sp.]
MTKTKVLVFGVTGMLGNAMFRYLSTDLNLIVYGTARGERARQYFPVDQSHHLITGVDVENHDSLVKAFSFVRPDIVINCVGLVKQLAEANDPLIAVPINTLLPHRLAALCNATSARLVHISTDCVFSGSKGNYLESDFPDAYDLYGRTKLLGEVDYPNAITLRTSIIGHELVGQRSLLGWFLAQKKSVKGFTKAIFSGVPTVELSRIVHEFVLPRQGLHGLYHISSKPINKFELLKNISTTYKKNIEIIPDESLVVDRSLNSQRFTDETGYVAPNWPTLTQRMYDFK